jgi:hypothetical protein
MAELFRQLAYAPAETLSRIMLAAEELAGEVERGRVYPEEFIAFRLTRFRAEPRADSVMLVGEAVIADLATFVQEVSRRLALPAVDEASGGGGRGRAEPIDDLAKSLNIAPRTLRRHHARGLLFHYVLFAEREGAGRGGRAGRNAAGGARRLACYEASLERFRRANPGAIDRASAFSRVHDADEAEIVKQARSLHAAHGWSRQKIAREIAGERGRAVETVRLILERHEREAGRRVFGGARRAATRERRFACRAWAWGRPAGEIARRLRRSPLTVRRVINAWRVERVRAWAIDHIALPTFDLPGAAEVILAPAAARSGLAIPDASFDAVALLVHARGRRLEQPAEEARLAAFNFLKRRAAEAARIDSRDVSDEAVDRAETDLRWAILLKRALACDLLGGAIVRAEQATGRALVQQDGETIRSMIALAAEVIGEAIDTVDPSRGQRCERVISMSMDRALARRSINRHAARAGAIRAPGSMPMDDPFARLASWQADVELPARARRRVGDLPEAHRALLDAIHGLGGNAPLTRAEAAARLGMSAKRVTSQLAEARGLLHRLAALPSRRAS